MSSFDHSLPRSDNSRMPQQISDPRPLLGRISDAVPTLYLVGGSLLLLLFCFLTPPFFNPDEAAHAERALQVSHGEWIAHYAHAGQMVTVLANDVQPIDAPLAVRPLTPQEAAYGASLDTSFLLAATRATYLQRQFIQQHPRWTQRPDGRLSLDRLDALKQLHWSRSSVFVPFLNTAVYPAPLYLPAALAWRVGEANNASVVATLYASRLCNALIALMLGWLALRFAGRNRLLFLGFLLLPAVLAIETSCAQDALVLPLATLCVSLLVRALSQQRLFRPAELAVLALALALCAAARPPYLALSVLLLLPSIEAGALQPRRLLPPAVALFAVFSGYGVWRFLIRAAGLAHSATAIPAAQLAFMRAHPFVAGLALVRGTLAGVPEQVFRGTEVIELKGVLAMALFYGPHILAFGGIVLLARQVVLRREASKLLLAAALFAIVAGIAVVEYIIWTAPGASMVIGAQARYYLPLVPFAVLLSLRRRTAAVIVDRPAFAMSAPRLLLSCLVVFFAGVLYTPFLLAHQYYAVGLPSALAHVLR